MTKQAGIWAVPVAVFFFATILALVAGPSVVVRQDRLPAQGSVTIEIKSQEDPATWLPEGNIDNQDARGNFHTFKVKWSTPIIDPASRRLVVQIHTISKYPGTCNNSPINNPNVNADFKMEDSLNGDWNIGAPIATGDKFEQWAVTKNPVAKDTEVTLKVSSFDFAAEAKVLAHVDKEVSKDDPETDYLKKFNPNQPDVANDDIHSSNTERFPADGDENHIPDAYIAKFPAAAGKAPEVDDDDQPVAQTNAGPAIPGGSRTNRGLKGDGLVVWEEYRGCSVKGKHVRLDPGKKDLYIRSEVGAAKPGPTFIGRIGAAKSLNVTIHEIYGTELTTPPQRIINGNNNGNGSGEAGKVFFNSTAQKSLHVVQGKLPADMLGLALGGGDRTARRKVQYIGAGPNGKCESLRVGDDDELGQMGSGFPNDPYIFAGDQGLGSTPGGDDTVTTIGGRQVVTTGPNGIRETQASPNDISAPSPLCIGPGQDGELQSSPAGDDTIVEVDMTTERDNAIALTPNEIYQCIIDVGAIQGIAGKRDKDTGGIYTAAEANAYFDTVLGHEIGHGVHIAHWAVTTESGAILGGATVEKKINDFYAQSRGDVPTVMTMGLRKPGVPVPGSYSDDEFAQIRLHLKHE